MKVGDLLADGCTNSIGHTPVSSCMPCAASGTRNGCCPHVNSEGIPRWLKCSSDAHMLCPVLSMQLSSLALGCSFHRGEALCRGKETLGEEMQNSTSWHCARSEQTSDVTVCCVHASFQATDRCSTVSLIPCCP